MKTRHTEALCDEAEERAKKKNNLAWHEQNSKYSMEKVGFLGITESIEPTIYKITFCMHTNIISGNYLLLLPNHLFFPLWYGPI